MHETRLGVGIEEGSIERGKQRITITDRSISDNVCGY